MANIIAVEPIRYQQDEIRDSAHGLITCNETNYLDLTLADKAGPFTFSLSPDPFPASVNCALVFNTGDGWFRLDNTGAAVQVDTQDLTDDSVLEEGNTIAELTALTEIAAFANKRVRYAIALETLDPENVKPRIKFTVNGTTLTQQLTTEITSSEYEFDDSIVITGITNDSQTDAGGVLSIQGRYVDTNSEDMAYTDWMSLTSMTGAITNKIQFKCRASVSDIGISQAILNSLKVSYNEGGVIAAAGGVSEIITVTRDWRRDLRHCRVVVRHAALDESYIKCYVSLRAKSKKITGESLGTGNGQRMTVNLAHNEGLKLDSVRLYFDGVSQTGGFDINCQAGRLTFEAPEGVQITCDYEYGWEVEEWQELELDYTESFDGYDQSIYRITFPEQDKDSRSMAVIKLALHTVKGSESGEKLGVGTGILSSYRLREPVTNGQLVIKSNGAELSTSRWNIESNTRYVRVNAPIDSVITADYAWESASPVIYQVSGVFSE